MTEGRDRPTFPHELEREKALAQIAEYYEKIQERLHDQETKFDKAVLLVAGGAFTVSLTFVPKLAAAIVRPGWLATAWVAWGLCLAVGIGAYLLSTYAHRRALGLLDREVYDIDQLQSAADIWIQWVGYTLYVLLVTGFVSFGVFAYSNLDFARQGGTTHDSSEDTSQVDRPKDSGGAQDLQEAGRDFSVVSPTPATGIPQAPTAALVTGDSDAEEPRPNGALPAATTDGTAEARDAAAAPTEGNSGRRVDGPAAEAGVPAADEKGKVKEPT